jgi:hypothetical protein
MYNITCYLVEVCNMYPSLLAHGALGPFDELIFLAVGVIFLVMMGVSWLKSRNVQPEFDEPETPAQAESTDPAQPDRFKLE